MGAYEDAMQKRFEANIPLQGPPPEPQEPPAEQAPAQQ